MKLRSINGIKSSPDVGIMTGLKKDKFVSILRLL
jgi:hypothetical protein